MRHAARLIVLLGLSLASQRPAGGAEVSLALEWHYRPGKFIPVRVARGGAGEIRISAPGCVTTVVGNPGDGEIVAPFLAVSDSLTALQVSNAPPIVLKPLGEQQRLVVTADADGAAARAAFPNEELVTVALDLNRPLLEPVLAWTGVDAVVLSPAARGRVSDKQISVLLAGGVAIVVAGGQKPDERWPWESVKDNWVLQHEVAGPREPIRAEAYSSMYAWDRGVPGAVRRQIMFVAVVFAILAMGLSLWRGRYPTVGFVGLCAVAGGFVFFAYMRGPRELTMRKTIIVNDGRLTQGDDWIWFGCLRDSTLKCSANGLTFPVFASGRQIERCEPRLICDGQGRPVSYEFRMAVKESLAFLTRSVAALPVKAPAYLPTEPVWKEFAENLYVRAGDRLEGEGAFDAELNATFVSRPRK